MENCDSPPPRKTCRLYSLLATMEECAYSGSLGTTTNNGK